MKIRITFLFFVLIVNAQNGITVHNDTQWLNGWTNFKPKNSTYKEANVILSGDISTNLKLLKKNVYRLSGIVRVINKAVLSIEPGTVILGDSENTGILIVSNGAKIIAEGLETDPIVFTSSKKVEDRKAGDWGGIVILGNAPINKVLGNSQLEFNDELFIKDTYGGSNIEDNSGVLKYVRIEFAGKKITKTSSINALTLGGVGAKTKFENIQVSFSNDDAFQILGGKVNMSKILTYKNKDDDFDINHGCQCKVTNSLIMRSPNIFDITRSRAFEIKNHNEKEGFDSNKGETSVFIDNVAIVTTDENKTDAMKEAVFVNENVNLTMSNVIVSGYKSIVAFDKYFYKEGTIEKLQMNNIIAENCQNLFSDVNYKINFETEESLRNIKEKFSNKCLVTNDNIIFNSMVSKSIDSGSRLVNYK